MGRFKLVAKEGLDAGRVFYLRGDPITLGRPGADGDSTVEFDEPSVSRVHALLKWRADQDCYEFSNRSFTSPSRINGEPASSGALLVHGTLIQMGSLVVQVLDSHKELPDPEPFMGCLELIQGPEVTGTRYPLHRVEMTIGRSPECDMHLDSPALSLIHASIEWYEKLPVLLPKSSREIYVNGNPIPQGTFLRPNDFILLGTGVALRWLPVSVLAKEERPAPAPETDLEVEAATPEPEICAEPSTETPRPEPGKKATTSQRAAFFADLAGRLERGEPIRRAVEESAQAFMPVLAGPLHEALGSGQDLAETLARFPKIFTPYELGMVAAGEEAGLLDELLRTLSDSLEAEHRARRRRLQTAGWTCPFLALIVTALCLVLLGVSPGPAGFKSTLGLSLAVTTLLALSLGMTLKALQRRHWFNRQTDRLLDRLPLIGSALRLQAGERFLKVLGPLLRSGLPAHRGALLAAGCTGSATHTMALRHAADRIEKGEPVLDSLAPTGLLSAEVLAEVEKGEEHGDLPERLAASSARLEEASHTALARAVPFLVLGPALLVALLSALSAALVWLASR